MTRALKLTAALLAAAAAPQVSAQDGEGFPERDIRIISPTSPGGGMDTGTRQIQPFWEQELGVNVIVDNRPGAGQAMGTQMFLRQPEDCYTVLNGLIPVMQLSHMTREDVDYTYEGDFYPVGASRLDVTTIAVLEGSQWETIEELIEDARARPGEITMSVGSLTNNQYQAAVTIESATGADFNIIPYNGGGPGRMALISGEVDATIAGVYNSISLMDEMRVLAVMSDDNDWEELTDNAPTINEALGTEIPNNQNREGYFADRQCYENHPERFKVLAETYAVALANPDYLAQLRESGEEGKIVPLPPEEFHQWILEETRNIQDFVETYPEILEQ